VIDGAPRNYRSRFGILFADFVLHSRAAEWGDFWASADRELVQEAHAFKETQKSALWFHGNQPFSLGRYWDALAEFDMFIPASGELAAVAMPTRSRRST